MRKIEIPIEGKFIYMSKEDMSEEDIRKEALTVLLKNEIKLNEEGNPRWHINVQENFSEWKERSESNLKLSCDEEIDDTDVTDEHFMNGPSGL